MSAGLPESSAFVCNASSCRRQGRDLRESLVADLEDSGLRVLDSTCMGVCDGLVAAVPVGARIEIVPNAHKPKAHRRIVAAATTGRRSKIARISLTGTKRRKALNKLVRKVSDQLVSS